MAQLHCLENKFKKWAPHVSPTWVKIGRPMQSTYPHKNYSKMYRVHNFGLNLQIWPDFSDLKASHLHKLLPGLWREKPHISCDHVGVPSAVLACSPVSEVKLQSFWVLIRGPVVAGGKLWHFAIVPPCGQKNMILATKWPMFSACLIISASDMHRI